MPICKRFSRRAPKTVFFAAVLFFAGNVFPQSAPTAPAAPAAPSKPSAQGGGQVQAPRPVQPIAGAPSGIAMPSMPRVSAPVAGTSFYTPGKRFLGQTENSGQAQGQDERQKSAASSGLEASLLGADEFDFSGLTAQDLVQLARSGSISNVSSLLGYSSATKSGLSSGAADNQVLLKKILSELEEIKKSQESALAASASGTKPSALPPKILRFVVNANDILSKCVQVYFSDLESDGTFLLTGDARTLVQNETVSETFYLLFKASGTKNSKTIYQVSAELSQSGQAATALSEFCSAKNLSASRVGNLVALRAMQDGVACDLLLDIGSAR